MPVTSRPRRLLLGLSLLLFTLILGYLVLRPFHLRWGATAQEVSQAMPGDLAGRSWTRAVTIQASPDKIYPWLLQWGQGRGGWYSYDWLENLLGFDIHSAKEIRPEWQNLAVGDPICMAPNACPSKVTLIEKDRWLSWQAADESGKPVWTFTFGLFPLNANQTRLVVRESFDPTALPSFALMLIEIPDVVMEQKALQVVKLRAEGVIEPPFVTWAEIGLWLAAFGIGLAAGIMALRRADFWLPLTLGLASVVVLLLLTFLFPPLWMRFVLVLALGAAWTVYLRRVPHSSLKKPDIITAGL